MFINNGYSSCWYCCACAFTASKEAVSATPTHSSLLAWSAGNLYQLLPSCIGCLPPFLDLVTDKGVESSIACRVCSRLRAGNCAVAGAKWSQECRRFRLQGVDPLSSDRWHGTQKFILSVIRSQAENQHRARLPVYQTLIQLLRLLAHPEGHRLAFCLASFFLLQRGWLLPSRATVNRSRPWQRMQHMPFEAWVSPALHRLAGLPLQQGPCEPEHARPLLAPGRCAAR